MKPLALLAGLSAILPTAPALALTTITFDAGSGVLPPGFDVFQDFDSFSDGSPGAPIGTNAFVFSDTLRHQGTRPVFGSPGNFAAVQSGGSFTVNFAPTSAFSFALGSLDGFNSLTLLYEGGASEKYVGGQIIHGLGFADNSQIHGRDNGVVTYAVTDGPRLIGAVFRSSGNAFEFDNLAIDAMPEPAAWAMLIGGFGLVGAASRRRGRVLAA